MITRLSCLVLLKPEICIRLPNGVEIARKSDYQENKAERYGEVQNSKQRLILGNFTPK